MQKPGSPGRALVSPVPEGPIIRPEEIEIDVDDPDVKIGEGAFGLVLKGRCRGMDVAVKTPKMEDASDEDLRQFKEEVRMMSRLLNPRIALFMGAAYSEGDVQVVTELLDGDLNALLGTSGTECPRALCRKEGFRAKCTHCGYENPTHSLHQRMLWAKQVAEGLCWVHGAGVVHRDLKPSNVLYSRRDNSVKICDFGFSIEMNRINRQEMKGSPAYIAPEVLQERGSSPASDVYSFGILLHFFVTRSEPYPGYELRELPRDAVRLFTAVCGGLRPALPDSETLCPASLRALCERCWHADPAARPTFVRVIDVFDSAVLVDSAVFSTAGRDFWNKASPRRGDVAWLQFWRAFERHFCSAKSASPAAQRCVKELFCAKQGDRVMLATFGHVLGYFGPLCVDKWLDRVCYHTLNHNWFHGDISRERANKLLSDHPEGTFLVRFGQDSNFSLSLRIDSTRREVLHARIMHPYASNFYQLENSDWHAHDLEALVECLRSSRLQDARQGAAQRAHVVRKSCPGSSYPTLLQEGWVDAGGYVVSLPRTSDSDGANNQ